MVSPVTVVGNTVMANLLFWLCSLILVGWQHVSSEHLPDCLLCLTLYLPPARTKYLI